MPFLTYDPNAISQLLAQGNPMGQGIGQIGQAMQQFAGLQMQQREMKLREDLNELQQDEVRLSKLQKIATIQADLYFEMAQMSKEDPIKFAALYPSYRKEKIEKNKEYQQFLPEKAPPIEEIIAGQKLSEKWLSYSTLNRQKLEAQRKAQEDADKAGTLKQNVTAEEATTFLTGQALFGKDVSSKNIADELPEPQGKRFAQLIKDRANQIISEKGGKTGETSAMKQAMTEAADIGIIKKTPDVTWYDPTTYTRYDYMIDEEKYNQFAEAWSSPITRQQPKGSATTGTETKETTRMVNGRKAVFDATTKQFIRWAD